MKGKAKSDLGTPCRGLLGVLQQQGLIHVVQSFDEGLGAHLPTLSKNPPERVLAANPNSSWLRVTGALPSNHGSIPNLV